MAKMTLEQENALLRGYVESMRKTIARLEDEKEEALTRGLSPMAPAITPTAEMSYDIIHDFSEIRVKVGVYCSFLPRDEDIHRIRANLARAARILYRLCISATLAAARSVIFQLITQHKEFQDVHPATVGELARVLHLSDQDLGYLQGRGVRGGR